MEIPESFDDGDGHPYTATEDGLGSWEIRRYRYTFALHHDDRKIRDEGQYWGRMELHTCDDDCGHHEHPVTQPTVRVLDIHGRKAGQCEDDFATALHNLTFMNTRRYGA